MNRRVTISKCLCSFIFWVPKGSSLWTIWECQANTLNKSKEQKRKEIRGQIGNFYLFLQKLLFCLFFLPTTCKCIRTKPRVTQPHTSNTFVEGSELKKTPTVWRWDLKCCRNHHSGGLNINEKLFVSAENVSVGIFSTVVGISDNLVSTHHCSSITTGPDQTDQWEKGTGDSTTAAVAYTP